MADADFTPDRAPPPAKKKPARMKRVLVMHDLKDTETLWIVLTNNSGMINPEEYKASIFNTQETAERFADDAGSRAVFRAYPVTAVPKP